MIEVAKLEDVTVSATRMASDQLLDPWVSNLVNTLEMERETGVPTREEWELAPLPAYARDSELSLRMRSLTFEAMCLDEPSAESEPFAPVNWTQLDRNFDFSVPDAQGMMASSSTGSTSPRSMHSSESRKKKNKPKDPSRFCHICLRRSGTGVPQVVCGNFYRDGSCRKVVCKTCLDRYNLDMSRTNWPCPHCLEQCPKKAQCKTYERINASRQRGPSRSTRSAESADARLQRAVHSVRQQLLRN
eukprot:Plantae.Rhodophyta-Purpureofilum_apyrenoidigerum.ctg40412.p1 GENE.Plantae.Rhodophyta-Purpureofilum_apyrenoidigerum.ctg40412~~Plantae.Rhodophyta-Purpureofilum_apyrenoidigerum.ctg40412.p1  ORF type:complete len:266 (+),score=32.83 Plantae.Rhodophyta-Purpureofilum_apyrenoidigerum.ctg40412:66-800(+)